MTTEPTLPHRRSIGWYDGKVRFIDQRQLPERLKVTETDDWRDIAGAIQTLAIRGAPLIGVAAALGVAAAAVRSREQSVHENARRALDGLRATRPTAANLFWALERMRTVLEGGDEGAALRERLVTEAVGIMEDDRRRCAAIGRLGARLIEEGSGVLTVCNTGFLATAGDGTALAIIYRAHDEGRNFRVFACETRPLLQGARLTAWELAQVGVPTTLLVDSAAAGLVASGEVNICIIGADRIAANCDTANKVGSYQLALACRQHGVPFYVAAPLSTVDPACPDGNSIPIEQRAAGEVAACAGRALAPVGVNVFNPAFDLVPAGMIGGIITEEGLVHPPYEFKRGGRGEEDSQTRG